MNKKNLCKFRMKIAKEVTFKRVAIIGIKLLPILANFSLDAHATGGIDLDAFGNAAVTPGTSFFYKFAPPFIGVGGVIVGLITPGSAVIKVLSGGGVMAVGAMLLNGAKKGFSVVGSS